MKLIITIVIGIIICLVAQLFIPIWWIFAPILLLVAFVAHLNNSGKSFLMGFSSVVVVWLSLYLFKDAANASLLSDKMATLFSIKSNYWLFGIVSGVMGILGGLSAMAGFYLHKSK